MNGAARKVILKAVVQLEVERHSLLQKVDGLAADIRACEARIVEIEFERGELLTDTGELSSEERVMLASARDMVTPSLLTTIPARPARKARKRGGSIAEPARPSLDDLTIISGDYTVSLDGQS